MNYPTLVEQVYRHVNVSSLPPVQAEKKQQLQNAISQFTTTVTILQNEEKDRPQCPTGLQEFENDNSMLDGFLFNILAQIWILSKFTKVSSDGKTINYS